MKTKTEKEYAYLTEDTNKAYNIFHSTVQTSLVY